ncbi:MAG: endonuclease III [Oscillospiraceae bacterium]|nr:endonuclease III [Oscillospiraceae bacterium]
MTIKQKKNIALLAIEELKQKYPDAICSLEYKKPYELLFAVRLSAQCTDARVNQVTPHLFAAFPTLESFAKADVTEVEKIIFSCGFYKAKAASLVASAKMLLEEFDGQVPNTMEDLLRLPGVGRKTANLILGDVYHQPAIVADTHCIRISGRLGLTDSKDPLKVEMALRQVIPPEEGSDFCHRIVLFGRDICDARKPDCGNCPMKDFCPSAGKIDKKPAKKAYC